jgi:hypothetical protein
MRFIFAVCAVAALALGLSLTIVGCNSSSVPAEGKKVSAMMGGEKMEQNTMGAGKMEGDKMNDARMDGDKMGGDKMGADKMHDGKMDTGKKDKP